MQTASVATTPTAVVKSQILLVDDHPLFRRGLALMLAGEPDLEVACEASTASSALAAARANTFDLAVLDVLMPQTSGMSLAAELGEIQPQCKILALSVLDEPNIVATMLRAGACGYALKTQEPNDIVSAIRAVLSGARYLAPRIPADAVLPLLGNADRPLERLTRREREIFELLIRGSSNDQIASKLFIARRTVETHRQRIIKKLATHSLLEMIRLAAREGALADDGAGLARDRR